MTERRMAADTAALAKIKAEHALAVLERWQHEHPTVGDYRVSDALSGLRMAVGALGLLYQDEHYPGYEEARQKLAEFLRG
ncbi:hypothetical protein [Streptomyces johnsoniae]|uniref:Uncharacterized protein n=1 Tax=Streptomyces johnsoniae TaxID=3075532 RepID=A0ABU2S2I2_9ACTN|nr:hypothetical protein [Streptomyces sp. DSM 41886]MDT0442295.1 hypothetical protein [Streptomyces sp. DSM 41886]